MWLGAIESQVVPLNNENTSLVEVLAASGGLKPEARVQNIKLIRGAEVYRVDLSTVSGMYEKNMAGETK